MIPLREIKVTFARSSGPGGQNVNKVSSKAVLRWPVARSTAVSREVRARFLERWAGRITTEGEVVIASDRFRDRGRNVADTIERLRAMLEAVAEPPRPRRPTRPPRAARERRLAEKRVRGEVKRLRSGAVEPE